MVISKFSFIQTHFFQVEMLYQRYFLKMNQSNMTNLITLLLLLCSGFLIIAAVDFIIPPQVQESYPVGSSHNSMDKLLVLLCTSSCCIAIYGGKYCHKVLELTIFLGKFFQLNISYFYTVYTTIIHI